jgi:hypothetical protein
MKNYTTEDKLYKSDYVLMQNEIDKRWNNQGRIEPGKTVYFHSAIQISRREFKKQFPQNPIVYNLAIADYYVSNIKPNAWYSFNNGPVVGLNDNGWRNGERLKELNTMVDFFNSKAIPVDPRTIKFKSTNDELPDEMVERIQFMLQSPDKETLDLGLKILFEYDHEKSLDKFYLLLCKANHMSFWRRKKSRVTEQKIKFIKGKFSNHTF